MKISLAISTMFSSPHGQIGAGSTDRARSAHNKWLACHRRPSLPLAHARAGWANGGTSVGIPLGQSPARTPGGETHGLIQSSQGNGSGQAKRGAQVDERTDGRLNE